MKNAAKVMTTKQAETHDDLTKVNSPTFATAKKILSEIMRFRRVPKGYASCDSENCQKCSSLFLPNIVSAINLQQPVTFVLPAFPGKSPNLEKVIGHLPDLAEQRSLSFLASLCENIKKYYKPGIKFIICSDGRVFSDVIGMQEDNVTAYQIKLDSLIKELSLDDISIFNLDEVYNGLSFDEMREKLLDKYGKSIESLKVKIKNGAKEQATADEKQANHMFKGITRFLLEDSIFASQAKSRTQLQNEAKVKSYEVIRRSNAWSDLIEDLFPSAIRLSIHPQVCGYKKLGIRLIHDETWMTPWHGVAVETAQGYILLKRSQAESMGAELVNFADGTPSHYKLNTEIDAVKLEA